MIKLKEIIKTTDCDCGGDCCSSMNENFDINLPVGMEMGKIFTGHGKSFIKEEDLNESTVQKVYEKHMEVLKSGVDFIGKVRTGKSWHELENLIKNGNDSFLKKKFKEFESARLKVSQAGSRLTQYLNSKR